MSDLAPILQGFFTDRLITQRHASPHTIRSYRDTCRLLLAFAQERHRHPAVAAGHRRPRRRPDHRVPAPPGNRAAATARHPQRPADRDPLAVPATRRCGHPEHAAVIQRVLAIPAKRTDTTDRQLPHRGRNRRAPRRPRPGDLDRTPRPRPAARRDPDRAARLRAHPAHPRRHPPGRRTARPLHAARAGKSGAPRSTRPPSRRCAPGSTEPGGRPERPPVPHPPRQPHVPRRGPRPLTKYAAGRGAVLPRHWPARTSPRTRSGITWTAGLCGRQGCFRWRGCRAGRFRPHNPGRYRQAWSSHSRRSWSAVQSARGSGVSDW